MATARSKKDRAPSSYAARVQAEKQAAEAKAGTDAEAEVRRALGGLGLVCDCGSLIERGGQQVTVVAVNRIDTPDGQRDQLGLVQKSFCGLDCEAMQQFEKVALEANPLLVEAHPLPTSRWIKRPSDYHPTQP